MNTDRNVTIEVSISDLSSEASIAALKSHLGSDSEKVSFISPSSESDYRLLDAASVIALVNAAIPVLTTLITAIFLVAKEKHSKRIVVVTTNEDGKEARLECPANTPIEQIEKLIELIRISNRVKITSICSPWG